MKKPAPNTSGIHDISETANRISQFGNIAMFFTFVTIVTNISYGNLLSAALVFGLFISMALILLLNNKGYRTIAKVSIVPVISFFLVLIAFAEGLAAGAYLYNLPLLFALPFLINNSKHYLKELVINFSIPIIGFILVLLECPEKSSWQYIPQEIYDKMFFTNGLCVVLLCAVFSYLSIYLERKYALALVEQRNKAEDAAEARTKFLSNMGHELRTPLNGIIGATNLIRSGKSLPDQKKYLDILKYCSDHMLGLVNDILDFNKIEQDKLELHPTKCNLKQVLSQSALPFYSRFEEKHLDLKLEIDPALDATILADDLRLVQVVNNILSNALKFTESGYVKLDANVEKVDAGYMHVLFSIRDTGIGIPSNLQKRIFESFWQVYNESTRKYGGTGLGLTICQRLLQLMNSSLELESEESKGSRFFFKIAFPIVEINSKATKIVEEEVSNLAGLRILVAEDNPINMMIAKKILEDFEATVTTCENGKIAVDALAENNNYNLILMDLEMPEMDGYTALKEIRKAHPHLPVVAFTAALMDNKMFNDLLEQGFKDCMLKPFQPLQLLAKIKKHALVGEIV